MDHARHRSVTVAMVLSVVAFVCSIAALVVSLQASAAARRAIDSNPFVAGSSARQAAERRAARVRASSHGRSLAMSILAYANDHNAEAPPEATWYKTLLEAGLVSPGVFAPPGAETVEHAFHYLRPTPDQVREAGRLASSDVVVIYEDPDLWGGEGGHVTYLDSRSEWIEGPAYRDRVRKLRARP